MPKVPKKENPKIKFYLISEAERNALVDYFQRGRGSDLPFKEVRQVLNILFSLKEHEGSTSNPNK